MTGDQTDQNDARQRGAVLTGEVKQNRLMIDEQAEDFAELMERLNSIEQMIERQNYTVAEDMLNRWRDQDADDFDLFTSEDHLKDFMENYDNYYKPVSNSGVSFPGAQPGGKMIETTEEMNAEQQGLRSLGRRL